MKPESLLIISNGLRGVGSIFFYKKHESKLKVKTPILKSLKVKSKMFIFSTELCRDGVTRVTYLLIKRML